MKTQCTGHWLSPLPRSLAACVSSPDCLSSSSTGTPFRTLLAVSAHGGERSKSIIYENSQRTVHTLNSHFRTRLRLQLDCLSSSSTGQRGRRAQVRFKPVTQRGSRGPRVPLPHNGPATRRTSPGPPCKYRAARRPLSAAHR